MQDKYSQHAEISFHRCGFLAVPGVPSGRGLIKQATDEIRRTNNSNNTTAVGFLRRAGILRPYRRFLVLVGRFEYEGGLNWFATHIETSSPNAIAMSR